jgi:hypothetical protein
MTIASLSQLNAFRIQSSANLVWTNIRHDHCITEPAECFSHSVLRQFLKFGFILFKAGFEKSCLTLNHMKAQF